MAQFLTAVGPRRLHELAREVLREVGGPVIPEKWDDLTDTQKTFFIRLSFDIYEAQQLARPNG